MERPHSIFIADDHVLFRQGIHALLREYSDLEVVGEASSGDETLEKCRAIRPSVALIDLQLPFADGFQVTRQIRSELPQTRVILLSLKDDCPDLVYTAVKAGAMGYMTKLSEICELVAAIRLVASGQASIAGGSLTNLITIIGSSDSEGIAPARHDEPLSEREEEVLDLVAQGYSNRAMASLLCISESTVRSHLHNILQKLHLSNRVQAATYALTSKRKLRPLPVVTAAAPTIANSPATSHSPSIERPLARHSREDSARRERPRSVTSLAFLNGNGD